MNLSCRYSTTGLALFLSLATACSDNNAETPEITSAGSGGHRATGGQGGGEISTGGNHASTGGSPTTNTGGAPTGSGGDSPIDGTPVDGNPFSVFYRGANLSGAEHGIHNDGTEPWGDATPGAEGSQYAWPHPDNNSEMDEVDLFLEAGMNLYRLPIAWERIQPSLSGDLDADYLASLKSTVEALRSRGATVLIDVHNYARYKAQSAPDDSESPLIGSAEVPTDALADVWTKLALEFGELSKTSPVWFDIMNEPHDIDAEVWATAANQAIIAIRSTGAQNVILVPPVQWGTAWDFSWHSGMQNHTQDIVDPLDNFAIQVHQYDHKETCETDADAFVDFMAPAEEWARKNGRRLFLGETNVKDHANCLESNNRLLAHLEANRLSQPDGVWIGWAIWAVSARGDWDALDNDSGSEGYMLPTLKLHLPSTCNDGVKSDDETDVDCGGACRRCKEALACETGNDCISGVCEDSSCQPL